MPRTGNAQFVNSLAARNKSVENRLNNLETYEPAGAPTNGSYVSRNISGQSNATNNYATISYETTLYGEDIDLTSGIFTVSEAGRWLVIVNLMSATTGSSKYRLLLNDTTVIWEHVVGTRDLVPIAVIVPLAVGDTLRVQFANNGGGTVTTLGIAGNNYANSFQVNFLVAA